MSQENGHGPGLPKRLKVTKQKLAGTAEAAELLGVERPRIGRWIKRGVMPDPVDELAATPVWTRKQIEAMVPWVEANRRVKAEA